MPETPTVTLPVARVAVDVSLPHLDRPFDYRVGPAEDEAAVPGARVRVRFAGRLRDGFVLERLATSDSDRELSPLLKVISSEPVLTPEIAALIRAVADHYAGCFADVLRLAVPPRHAATEKAEPAARPPLPEPPDRWLVGARGLPDRHRAADGAARRRHPPGVLAGHPGDAPERGLGRRRSPPPPGPPPTADGVRCWWCRTSVTWRSCAAACTRVLGRTGFVVLTAEAGPAARYRAFLAALRGDVRVVIGNRAAAYAPVHDLGLVALWDDGDDLLAEQRAPYPHTRTVLALRASQQRTAVLFAGYSRSCEAEQLLQRGWLLRARRRPHPDPAHRTSGAGDGGLRPRPGP